MFFSPHGEKSVSPRKNSKTWKTCTCRRVGSWPFWCCSSFFLDPSRWWTCCWVSWWRLGSVHDLSGWSLVCTAWTGDQDCVYHRTGTIGSGLCQEVFVGNDWQRPWARLCERVKKFLPIYSCTEFLLNHHWLWHIMTTPSTQDLKSFMCHRTCRSGWWQPNLWGRVSQCFKDSPGISVIPWHWRRSKHIEIYSSIGWGDSDEVEHDDNSPKAMAALTSLGVDVEAALDYGLLSCG